MAYQIRDATLDDLPRIVDIYNASIPERRATADTALISVESRLDWFAQHNERDRPLWVCWEDSVWPHEILGWISLTSFYGRPAYDATTEVSIYIAPSSQGQGVGTYLLQELIHYCDSVEINTLLGFVFGHNQASLHLFKKFGFEVWGNLPQVAVLNGVERDLIILGKRL